MSLLASYEPELAEIPEGISWPAADTIVLLNRKLRPGTDINTLSRFADDVWYLNAAIFEDSARSTRLNFGLVPAHWRLDAKYFCWQLLNVDETRAGGRPSPNTIVVIHRGLRTFLQWLTERGITEFAHVTPKTLDDYLTWLLAKAAALDWKSDQLNAVRKLWAFRIELPARMQLFPAAPWDGEDSSALLGSSDQRHENRTPRIKEQAMQTLLAWSIRFVEDFADDITAAFHEHLMLAGRTRKKHRGRTGTRHDPGDLRPKAEAYLDRLRSRGEGLPGKIGDSGEIELDWNQVARVLNCALGIQHSSTGERVRTSGLPVQLGAPLDAPITGLLDGQPWQPRRITFDEATRMARLLSTACLVIINYLSGARTGEVLSLRKGSLQHDTVTGLWLVRGRYWKGARDANGNKIPEGELRDIPWVVVDIVATAIGVLERLHDDDLLFPARLDARKTGAMRNGGRSDSEAAVDLNAFVAWINDYCRAHGRTDLVESDGRLNCSRFRRTLAWFIRRRPRGLVAASLQYGHVETTITQGYAGTYESGFPDDYAFEEWLFRMEIVAEDQQRLTDGEHVSGPAADTYRDRIQAAAAEFAGMVVPRADRARVLLADPRLQIFHGDGMTCVFKQETALCQMRTTADDSKATPDTDDCQPRCPNLARTDRDAEHIQMKITELAAIVTDSLAPPIRHQREAHELERLRDIAAAHAAGKLGATT